MNKETATQLIDDLPQSLIDYVKQRMVDKISKKSIRAEKYRSSFLYTFGDGEAGYIVLCENESTADPKIDYFVRYRSIKANGNRFGRQVLLWRNDDRRNPDADNFAQRIFFNTLLPKYGALISDTQQTTKGRRFWQNALSSAFSRPNLHVYFLDRASAPNRLTKLESDDEVALYQSKIWGHSNSHLRTHVVIANKPLQLKEK